MVAPLCSVICFTFEPFVPVIFLRISDDETKRIVTTSIRQCPREDQQQVIWVERCARRSSVETNHQYVTSPHRRQKALPM